MSSNSESQPIRYPLLESLLRQKGLSLQGIYKYKDAAEIFDASVRTIQQWVRDRKLRCRDLPARGRFLSEDLEAFLQDCRREGDTDKEGR
jgi:transposase